MTNILLSGANGKMGKTVAEFVLNHPDCKIVAGVDSTSAYGCLFPVFECFSSVDISADVIIDFSNPALLEPLLSFCEGNNLPIVICTTGFSPCQIERIKLAATKIPVFYSGNMSLGINLLIQVSKKLAAVLGESFNIEIIEKHHNQKIDAPSGTALMIADAVANELGSNPRFVFDRHSACEKRSANEIGIHSVRGGTITGEHEVVFAGTEEVISVTHFAQSRAVFANGAVNAAIFLLNKSPALYDMNDLLSAKQDDFNRLLRDQV